MNRRSRDRCMGSRCRRNGRRSGRRKTNGLDIQHFASGAKNLILFRF
jgi:hypothetical protein